MAEQSTDFSDIYSFSSDAGVIIADTAVVKSAVEQMLTRVFGADIDMTAETPMGRLVELLTVLMIQTLGVNAQNANQYNINIASGVYLDAIGALFGLPRRSATHTRVLCTVEGTSGTVLASSGESMALAENTEGYQFHPEESITIGQTGTATGYFVAVDSGPVPCDKGTLTTIVSGTEGWSSIINDTDTPNEYGLDLETDAEYKERLLAARSSGTASVAGITNAIYNADPEIKFAYVMENGYGQAITKRGITIPPHSIFVCVDPVTDANKAKIAKAIFKSKTAGAGYTYSVGDSSTDSSTRYIITVTDENTNNNYYVFFFEPVEVLIDFSVTVNKHVYAGVNLENEIKNALISYCSESGIGATLTVTDAVAYLAKKIPTIVITSLTMNIDGAGVQSTIGLNANLVPKTSETAITVSVS